jgi:hypothetical protein
VRAPAGRVVALALAAGTALLAGGCSSDPDDNVSKVAKDVLALKSGTVTEIKGQRGAGPFREYAVPQDVLFDVVVEVLYGKVPAVFPNRRAYEVVAKERTGKDRYDDWYAPDWVSAVVVYVHPVMGDEARSKLEIHATNRGPFHKGSIAWQSELPGLLDAAVLRRGPGRIRPL